MRLTTKGRFAVTAMIDLALRCSEGPVSLAGISERQKISLSYLERVLSHRHPADIARVGMDQRRRLGQPCRAT